MAPGLQSKGAFCYHSTGQIECGGSGLGQDTVWLSVRPSNWLGEDLMSWSALGLSFYAAKLSSLFGGVCAKDIMHSGIMVNIISISMVTMMDGFLHVVTSSLGTKNWIIMI